MAACCCWCLVILGMLCGLPSAKTLEINDADLGTRLKEISERGLGQSMIQEMFNDKATFTTKVPTGTLGHDIVNKLAASVGNTFKNYSDAVKVLHHRLIDGMRNLTSMESSINVEECCKLKPGHNTETWCFEHPSGSDQMVTYHQGILETMRENSRSIPHIGWQYYGNEQGLVILYPTDNPTSCTEYDPRLRPWYAEASAPTPKDIAIAVESTGHFDNSLIKNALDILLDTTNPNDRITVFKFGRDVNPFLGSSEHSTCFSQELALATPQNRRIFKEFINSEEGNAQGPVKLLPVINKAFDYFKRAEGVTQRRSLLVIFTASDHVDMKDPAMFIREIAQQNDRLKRKVLIQTYAFGANISNYTTYCLQRIAESTQFVTSAGRVQTGTFTHILQQEQLRLQLHSYYSIFADSAAITEPVVTVPYFDFSGLGLVMSLCLPLHLGGKLQGVTCVDVELEDLFFNVTYYHQGIDAYGFIIDNRGRTILHPLLPRPTERQEDPKFVNIATLEKDKGVQEVIDSMKSGGNGSRRFHSGRTRERLGIFAGSLNLVSEYFWTKIPDTDYSLCMVFTNRDREVQMELKLDKLGPRVKYIHPYTLIHGDNSLQVRCQQDGHIATTDGSVVMFSGAAYKSLSGGVNPNNITQRRSYDNFFKGSANDQAPEFKESTRRWVRLSGLVDTIWMGKPSTEYDQHIVWRHLVTTTGVIRIYPGINYTQYNPSSFLWYKQAILSQDHILLHPVEKEKYFNVMISQAVMEVSSLAAVPIGVVGGEIRPTILYNILQDVYPACRTARCFIVDSNGYILAHEFYNDEAYRPSHIMMLEPSIAHYLIDNGHLKQAQCLDFLSHYQTLHSWRMAINGWYVSNGSPRFELHPIHGTNIFVVITWNNDAYSCNCKNITRCLKTNVAGCRCPCFETLKFNLCNNTLPDGGNMGPSACSIIRNNFDIVQQHPVKNVNTTLEPCFKWDCHDIETESFCSMKNGCQWCMLDNEKDPSCHNRSFCGPGVSPTRTVVIVAVPVILILLVTIIIIAVCFIFRNSLCVRAKLCVKKSLCGDPIYEQADKTVESTPKIKAKPIHDDSGIASDDVNDKTNIFVISVQDPESSESKPNAVPPLPNRNPRKKFLPDNHEGNPVSNKSQLKTSCISVFPESQSEKGTVAEAPGTPEFNQWLEDSAENTYVNESADVTFDPHEFESLSIHLSLFSENGQMRNDGNSHWEGNGVDNQGHSASNLGIVEDNSAGVSSRDSGVLSAVSRQGSSQTYLKTP